MAATGLADRPFAPRSALPFYAVVLAALFVTLGALAVAPVLAIVVPLSLAAVVVLWRVPLKYPVMGVMFLVFLLEGLQIPLTLDWTPPLLYPLARLMLENLNATTGIGPLRAPLIDMITVALWAASTWRAGEEGFTSRTPSVRALNIALLVSFLAVVGLDLIGTARGGNFNESLWQMRHLLLFPLRTVLLLRAFDGTVDELKSIAKMLIAATWLKAAVGIYLLRFIVYASGSDTEFTTSHTDTLLFVPVLALFFNMLVEGYRVRLVLNCMAWAPIIAYGMVCNDRRLAYVCLGASCLTSLLISGPTRFKKVALRAGLVAAPVLPLYMALGWNSEGGLLFFVPRLLKSLIVGDPNQGNQADYRDIENLDVLFTWSNNPIVPYGFGGKFFRIFPLPDISRWMPTWEYHPHNQWLWLFTIGGPIGFTLMMLPMVIGLYLCTRTYRFADNMWDRVAALTGISIFISYFCQVYGDMGTLSWTVSWMPALACALASKVAVRVGAWPGPRSS